MIAEILPKHRVQGTAKNDLEKKLAGMFEEDSSVKRTLFKRQLCKYFRYRCYMNVGKET